MIVPDKLERIMRTAIRFLLVILVVMLLSAALVAQDANNWRDLGRAIFKELIETNTSNSTGSTTPAAEKMAKRLLDAGFEAKDVHVLGPDPHKGNLVARLRGTGKRKPMLLICHLDVVEARRDEWSVDPFTLTEKDGYYYGRGTQDVKDGDAALVTTLIRMKKEGYKPDRDIIVALTADEEAGSFNGVEWLLKNHRDLIDAEYVINPDAGDFEAEQGKPVSIDVEATEKAYADFQLQVTNKGGHSSLPVPDNAIYHLADALEKIAHYRFPFELNAVTADYFEATAKRETGQKAADLRAILEALPDKSAVDRLSADPFYNARMRTTCVATRLDAGHANNALPQTATAVVNCRIMPGYTRAEIQQMLRELIADPQVAIRYLDTDGKPQDQAPGTGSFLPPPVNPEVRAALEKIAGDQWPGVTIVPIMSSGASDSTYTMAVGIPSYGIYGFPIDRDDDRAHGRDERLPIKSFDDGVVFYYQFLKLLSGHELCQCS
jgi:acetylornithine deacetylase/succinyl-diaminopimelate desuccinylase-like protein